MIPHFLSENETPSIDGQGVMKAKVNVTINMQFNISDDGTAEYKILKQPNKNFHFDNMTGNATWTPYDTNITNIRYLYLLIVNCDVLHRLEDGIGTKVHLFWRIYSM